LNEEHNLIIKFKYKNKNKKGWTRDQTNHRMAAAITTRAPHTTAAQAQKQQSIQDPSIITTK